MTFSVKIVSLLTLTITSLMILSSCNKTQTSSSNLTPTPNIPTPVVINKQVTPTVDEQGFILNNIENLKLTFFAPADWQIYYDSFANKNYVEISFNQTTTQIFYNQNLPYSLTDEQKSKARPTQNKIIKVDGRQISSNLTELDGGGVLLTINLPAQGKKPPITIWFVTNDRAQTLPQITHLLETLTFK